jgi:hypothetical protein
MIHDPLTTERIRKKFKNNFDLCNFAINIARNMILASTPATLAEILRQVEDRVDESKEPNALS